MNVKNTNHGRRAGARLLALALALSLAACGGGGGNPGTIGSGNTGGGTGGGTGTGNTAQPTVALALVNSSTGQASNSLSGANQLTVKATVRDKVGAAVPNTLVTFATDNNLAVFSPAAGTALTDPNGVATVSMKAASLAADGAGNVTVTTNVGGTPISATSGYSVNATPLRFGTLTVKDPTIQAYGSTTLSVNVLAGTTPYTDQVNVSFSSKCVLMGKATLAAVVPTNKGVAETVYRDQGCGDTDVITASATGVATPAIAQLDIAPPAAASVQFVSALPNDQSIVIQGQGGNGRTETATLKFRVVDIFSKPLPGQPVTFSASTTAVTVNKTSDTTDANGEVITTVNSGTVPTSFRVLATLPNTGTGGKPDISTWSDTVVVTTGLPVQRAFSLSAAKFNLDRTIDSTPTIPATTIQAMIGDNSGNPVPDGTPVVFQTNMGSVGTSARGGCTTTNGGCSVEFRMQDPRVPGGANLPATACNILGNPDSTRPGVATVCASTTDGTNTVFKNIYLYFSGNTPDKVYMDGARLNTGVATDLGTVRADASRVFTIQINDNNDNPLPAGTSVSVVNLANAVAGAALPASVASISPIGAPPAAGGLPQGSSHMFTITSAKPTGCTADLDATFSVAVTTPGGGNTPGGVSSYIPFKLRFSCP